MPPTGDCIETVREILRKEKHIYDGLESEGTLAFAPKAHYSRDRWPSSVLLSERFTTSFYYRPRYMQQLHQQYYLNASSEAKPASSLHKRWQSSKKTVHEEDVRSLRSACALSRESTPSNKTFEGQTIALYRIHNASQTNMFQSVEKEVEVLESSGWQVLVRNYLFGNVSDNSTQVFDTFVKTDSIRELYRHVRGALRRDVQHERAKYFLVWDDSFNFTHTVVNNLAHISDHLPDDMIAGAMAFEKYCFDWSEEGFPELLDSLKPEEMYTSEGGFCCRHLLDGKLDYNGMYQIYHINNETFIAPQHVYSGGK